MQLIAGRTAEEYNQRKGKQGAFWEDRYHATAIETDEHLHRCMVYIDFNMVRAGVVNHPAKWKESGFSEIEKPPKRYATIDLPNLIKLSGFADLGDFQRTHRDWVEQAQTSLGHSATFGGRKQSPLAVWLSSRKSKVSLAPELYIVNSTQ